MSWNDGSNTDLNTAACAKCHGSLPDFNFGNRQTDTDALVDELRVLLVAAGLVDGTSGAPLSVTVNDADSLGAVWNYVYVQEDASRGVHNWRYTRDLLTSAIQFMEGTLPPSPVARRQSGGRGASE